MAEYTILSENTIEVYKTPDHKVKQQVVIYQADGFAPRTVWLDRDKLPDLVYQDKNPGKTVPAEVQSKGDAVRRAAFEADITSLKQSPQPRKI